MKRCSQKSHLAKSTNHICNPVSGKWILIGGPTYNTLVSQGTISAVPLPSSSLPISINKSCPLSNHLANDPDYICNPTTGKWIKIGSKVYTNLLSNGVTLTKQASESKTHEIKMLSKKIKDIGVNFVPITCIGPKKPNFVCNPQTGEWIGKCSLPYQRLVENYIINGNGDIIYPKMPAPIPVVS